MSGNILWKLVLSAAIISWAVLNVVPVNDSPFEESVLNQVSAEEEAFQSLFDEAQARVEAGEAPSLFVALRDLGGEADVDYQAFFPHINVIDVQNQESRNTIILNEVLNRSKGNLKRGLDLLGGIGVTFQVADPNFTDLPSYQQEEQLSKVVSILRQRLDSTGVAEPVIRPVGEGRVEVQLPGLSTRDNPDIIETISKPAKLEFRLVNRETPFVDADTPRSELPAGFEKLTEERVNPDTGEMEEITYLVKRLPEATGEIVAESFPAQNSSGQFEVSMRFTGEGSDIFRDLTTRILEEDERTGTKQLLAIVLDGQLYSAPQINGVISSRGSITGGQGGFSQREAIELSSVLNNPLDVQLEVAQTYEVEATLAEDAREASVNASILGAILVVIFMVFYYWAGGVVGVISSLANITIVLGVLASFDATLTLPGVAALVLTLGMGVDANILIFERLREELKNGKSLRTAVRGGFDKAFSAIIDANVTTLITAMILFYLGTGPVKGFGLTLAIGICSSVFSALVISRFILEILVNLGVNRLLGMGEIPIKGVDFLSKRKIAFASSWTIVLVGVISVVINHDNILGTDFTGGDEVTLKFSERVSPLELKELGQETGFGAVGVVYQQDLGTGEEVLKLQTDFEEGRAFAEQAIRAFPDAAMETIGVTQIGASVSANIQMNALLSVLAALVGILFYIAVRFEIGYGIGAVAATIHDVLMTVGIFVLAGGILNSGQFTAPMLAAILMIVGYSINDTIVVFDRIREELDLNPDAKLYDIVNLAINRVLNRSLLTSITTFLASLALYIFGAGVINDFAFVFLVGILTGTFSSIFIASPIFFWWHKGDRKHVEEREFVPKKDWEITSREARGEAT